MLQKENSFCLSEAIRKLVVFCKELPFIESAVKGQYYLGEREIKTY